MWTAKPAMVRITVTVALMSGNAVDLRVKLSNSITELMKRAQQQLGFGGRLLTSGGVWLDATITVRQAGLQSGDVLTLQATAVECAADPSNVFSLCRSSGGRICCDLGPG